MLDVDSLKETIRQAMHETGKSALEEAWRSICPSKSDAADRTAENFSNVVVNIMAEPLAEILAQAIVACIKNAELYGTIITAGSPTTQTAIINSSSVPKLNGIAVNTLGIR